MFLGETFEAVSENLESDPTSYEEAMADSDSSYWVKAMKTEMECMNSIRSEVCGTICQTANIKPISCK